METPVQLEHQALMMFQHGLTINPYGRDKEEEYK